MLLIGWIRLSASLMQLLLFSILASGHDSVASSASSACFLSALTTDVLCRAALGPSQTLTSHLGDPQLPPLLLQLLLPDSMLFGLAGRQEVKPPPKRREDGRRDLCFLPLFGPRWRRSNSSFLPVMCLELCVAKGQIVWRSQD